MPHWPLYTGPDKDITNSLGRTKLILNEFDNPQKKIKNIFHITGTKGKGSTVMYISNILRDARYNVNTYISPHIYECNERILLNGEPISDKYLLELIETIRITCDKLDIVPSFFETMTACAMIAFSNSNADANVIEVGMGGLTDPTNLFDKNPPICSIITPIHLDHTIWLGNSIESVAIHKSDIIKQNTHNVVIGPQPIEAKQIILAHSEKHQIPKENIFIYGENFEVYNTDDQNEILFESEPDTFTFQKPSLLGEYQLINAGNAIAAVLSAHEKLPVSINNISNGIKNTKHIVRMEQVTSGKLFDKLPKDSLFFMDGAHNHLSAFALSKLVSDLKIQYPKHKIFIAIARSKGADNISFVSQFLNIGVDLIICTRANLESLPEPPENIAKICDQLKIPHAIAYTITEAINIASQYCNQDPCIFIATGSLYIARDIKEES